MSSLSKVISNDQMERITSEFKRLGDRCYLENAGSALYPQSLLENVNKDLTNNVYMNPHTDKYTKDCIDQIRGLILKHFNTNPSSYTVIFTSGTTQALKTTVESFQFASSTDEVLNCGSFVYLLDNHTSVLGLREIAEQKNADIIHISHNEFLQSLPVPLPAESAHSTWKESYHKNEGNTLFAYPAQNNFNGFKYPIDCIQNITNGCLNSYIKKNLCKVNCNWYVLLDAASYVPTNKLDLSHTKPDFVSMSFYKIFGFPTGLGALLVKNSSANVLSGKRYFGGGTVDLVLSSEAYHVKRSELFERFEDGTVSFLDIIALKHGFDALYRLIPKFIGLEDPMVTISHHTFFLAKDLYKQLKELKHPNGKKAVITYMDTDFSDIKSQGGIVTFNLLRDDGTYIGYAEFQHMANLFNIDIRTGCFCNSGSCQRHLNVTNKQMKDMYKAGHKCGDDIDLILGQPTGAIRVSFAYYNTYNDVDKLVKMIIRCFVKTKFLKPRRSKISLKCIDFNKSEEQNVVYGNAKKLTNENGFLKHVDIFRSTLELEPKIKLVEIAIFPVKSCGAFKVDSTWRIGSKGLEYDREWMVIRDNGVCLTQKQNTRMCLIKPTIDIANKQLVLSFSGQRPLKLPLDVQETQSSQTNSTLCQSKVCADTIKGYDCGDEAAQWISEALEISFLRLIRQSKEHGRTQKKEEEEKPHLSLSNQAQYLLINKATVRWLKNQIKDETFGDNVDQLTDRFRGNLVIDMDQELVERQWQKVLIGNHEFKVEGPCNRCQMVCIDQSTGEKTVEPLRTISEQFGGKLRFGIYLTHVGNIKDADSLLRLNSSITCFLSAEDISR